MSKNELNFFEQLTNVSYLPLKQLVKIRTGVNILASKLAKVANEQYCYPVVSGGKKPLGYWNQATHHQPTITISRNGSAGYVSWQEQPFYLNDVAMVFEDYEQTIVDPKYLYHFLKSIQNQLYEMANKSAIPCLRKSELDLINIPLPPLATQKAIATTLDKFNQLTNELTNELNLRQKQYQYYLKTLLDFANPEHPFVKNGGGVINKTLAEVVNFKRGQIITKMNALIQSQQLAQGPYPIISSATKPLAMFNQFNMESNQVVISSHGYAGYVSYQNQPFWATPLCHVLDAKDDQVLNNKFLYYTLIAKQNELNDLKAGGAIPFISQGDLKTIKIPIVDLEVQSQIVSALDHLSTLCNDLSIGLPAQIANANKQYHYYLKTLFVNLN